MGTIKLETAKGTMLTAKKSKGGKSRDRPRSFPLDPPGPEHVTLTLQETCVAELDGAVDLLVRFENLAAAHLLASAATELIRKRAAKLKIVIESDILERTKGLDDTTRQHIRYAIDHAYNGLKHSSGADGVSVYFRPEFVQFHLLLAVEMYQATFQDLTPKMAVFKTWTLFSAVGEHFEIQSLLVGTGIRAPKTPPSRTDVVLALQHIDEQPAQAKAAIKAAMSALRGASLPQPR
jgi:hypothetical protein